MLVEQPAAPGHMPECVFFWKTKEWGEMKKTHDLLQPRGLRAWS